MPRTRAGTATAGSTQVRNVSGAGSGIGATTAISAHRAPLPARLGGASGSEATTGTAGDGGAAKPVPHVGQVILLPNNSCGQAIRAEQPGQTTGIGGMATLLQPRE